MKEVDFHIGCSAFATPSWKHLFYPEDLPKSKWFEFYCQHFKTYEFNGSFYKFPTVKNLLTWHDKTPADFQFSIKIPKIISHIKKLQNCESEINEFYAIVQEGLKSKLACVLWQLPPSFNYSEERLDSIINSTNTEFKNVVEFRHESWWREDVMNLLRENNLIFCNVNYLKLPTEIHKNSSIGYIRMHGNPELFYSEYTQKQIEQLYLEIKNMEFEEIYIYFNNTASTAGIINALQFKNLMEK